MKKYFLIILMIGLIFAGWQRQNSPVTTTLYSVHFPVDTLFGIIVGENGTILRTTNSGNDWQLISGVPNQTLRCVRMLNNNVGFACGDNGTILKTTNGGLNWQSISSGMGENFTTIFFPENENVGYIFSEQGNGYKTTDGGITWEVLNMLNPMPFYSCYFVNNFIGFVVGEGGVVLGTQNGGEVWEMLAQHPCPALRSVWFVNQNVGYVCGEGGGVWKTTDGGRRWEDISIGERLPLRGIVFPNSSDTGYVCGFNSLVGRTFDGRRFETQFVSNVNLFAIHFPINRVGFTVGERGVILKTSDYGGIGIAEEKERKKIENFDNDNYYKIFNPIGKRINKINKKGIYFIKEKDYKKIVIF